MTEPITFTSQSPNFELPLLFAGQAQKEFFYNEAQLIIDALLHLSVEGTISTPPTEVEDGECWIVGTNAQSDWAGREQAVAVRHAGGWKFISPKDGMIAFDRSRGQRLHYDASWQGETPPDLPTGGSTIDHEARASIESLIASLQNIGLFAAS